MKPHAAAVRAAAQLFPQGDIVLQKHAIAVIAREYTPLVEKARTAITWCTNSYQCAACAGNSKDHYSDCPIGQLQAELLRVEEEK